MKKVIGKIFGQKETVAPKASPALSQPPVSKVISAPTPANSPGARGQAEIFSGIQSAYVIVVFFPDYEELAPFLSEEGRAKVMKGYLKAIENAFSELVCVIDLPDSGLATLAVLDSSKQSTNFVVEKLNLLDKELQTWVGTFGRTGLPPLKYKMGIAKGEVNITKASPKITGPSVGHALEIAKSVCIEFDVRIGATGEIIRASTDSVNWVDVDDYQFNDMKSDPSGKCVRIFTKMEGRLDQEEVQVLRAARKAYFLQNWDDAASKFDKLSRVSSLRQLTDVYRKRIEYLRTLPKNVRWNGVYK